MAGMLSHPQPPSMHGDGRLQTSSAFTTVPTRRALGRPPPTPSEPEKPKQPTVFPQAVREYVQRCFGYENIIPGITQDEMQQRLKEVINEAAEKHELNTRDWVSLPLPQQMIYEERKAFAASSARAKPSRGSEDDLRSKDPAPPSTDKPSPKKRKSSEISRDHDNEIPKEPSSPPPWRKAGARNVFEDRVSYPEPGMSKRQDKKQRKINEIANFKDQSKSATELERRRQRFGYNRKMDELDQETDSRGDTPLPEADEGPVIGTCQELEKKYFRLTSAPKPETVRPLPVLEKTLDLLKHKWKKDGNYSYICDQFKSLRQDLTVQHIRTSFTVNVYEIHARIALEKGDLGEYNQCQTQLRALYKQNLGGHPAEFLAYRILYMIYTCNRTDMNDVLADLTLTDREEPAVKHALAVRSALALGNYHRFFRLYLANISNMGGYLMDMFITRERLAALANICRAYKQVDLRFLTEELAFESDRETATFICAHNGAELLEKKENGPLFMSGKAGAIFETARAAFKRVDIKGQI